MEQNTGKEGRVQVMFWLRVPHCVVRDIVYSVRSKPMGAGGACCMHTLHSLRATVPVLAKGVLPVLSGEYFLGLVQLTWPTSTKETPFLQPLSSTTKTVTVIFAVLYSKAYSTLPGMY